MNFGDILNITPVGANQTHLSTICPPYAYPLTQIIGYSKRAKLVQDRYSVGIVILEMLIGTDLIITAKTQCQLEKLLKDCSQYFDPATMTVLEFLIFDEGHANLESYVNDYVHGEPDVIRSCILKFESALLEDSDLQ